MQTLRKILLSLILAISVLTLFFGDFTHITSSISGIDIYAADGAGNVTDTQTVSTQEKNTTESTFESFNNIINVILGLLTALVSPLIMLASWLMSPDWTSGDLFGLRAPMYKIWIVVSNIIYLIYGLMLIIIAIATMFNSKNY